MKLQVKHLAPYLPYKPKILAPTWLDSNKKEIDAVMEVSFDGYINLDNGYFHFIEDVKVFLRPLSDLTKEIQHNEESFIPMQVMQERFTKRLRFDSNGFYYHIDKSRVRGNSHDTHFPFSQLEAYGYLFKWHFDVFGLIEKGLAIDINKLLDN